MKFLDGVMRISDEVVAWRRHLHTIPETSFEEVKTAEFAAKKLAEFGLDVQRGIGKTGVVATLQNGEGPTIGLRLRQAQDLWELREWVEWIIKDFLPQS